MPPARVLRLREGEEAVTGPCTVGGWASDPSRPPTTRGEAEQSGRAGGRQTGQIKDSGCAGRATNQDQRATQVQQATVVRGISRAPECLLQGISGGGAPAPGMGPGGSPTGTYAVGGYSADPSNLAAAIVSVGDVKPPRIPRDR
jgi:hypothetical protein